MLRAPFGTGSAIHRTLPSWPTAALQPLPARIFHSVAADAELARIDQHERWGIPAVASAVGLSVFALALVLVGGSWGGIMTAVLTGLVLLLAVAAAFFVVRAGHSGATTVWSALQR